jgi:transcriptional regulator with XRE-family HTH domain
VDYRERILKLLKELGINRTKLAAEIGMDQAQLSRAINGEQMPSALMCVYFAGLSQDAADKAYWLSICRISESQKALIIRALSDVKIDLRGMPRADVKTLMGFQDLLGHPLDEQEKALGTFVKSAIEKHVELRATAARRKSG